MIKHTALFLVLSVAAAAAGFAVGVVSMRTFASASEPAAVREGDFRDMVESVGSPIVLLSTSTCAWCEKSRVWLRARRIAYRDCVVDENAHAAALLDRSGIATVPQLLNARRVATRYDPDAFEQIVRDALPLATGPQTLRCTAPDTEYGTPD